MMGPIKFIELQNWVSYEKARFDFHPNVNMIIGPSGKGKSAMMAAFQKLFYNRPMGNDFVSWWGGETRLITSADDWVLTYLKKKSKAYYHLVDTRLDLGIDFTAFGSAVPDDISNILGISDELNIQPQFKKKAPIFLLSETAGDAARKINTFANLHGIDETIKAGRDDISASKREIKIINDQIASKEKELEEYTGLDKLGDLLTKAEQAEKELIAVDKKIFEIENILHDLNHLNRELKEYERWVAIAGLLSNYQNLTKKMKEKQIQIHRIEHNQKSISIYKKELKATMKISHISLSLSEWGKFNIETNQLKYQADELKEILADIQLYRADILKYSREYMKARQSLKANFPDSCPLCNSRVNRALL